MSKISVREKLNIIERICKNHQIKITKQRLLIIETLLKTDDHPTAEKVYETVSEVNARVSLATVYRTLNMLEMCGVIIRHDFGGTGGARYEMLPEQHHDHLIDVNTGKIIEFHSEEIERLQKKIAQELGYHLVNHRLELFGIPLLEKDE